MSRAAYDELTTYGTLSIAGACRSVRCLLRSLARTSRDGILSPLLRESDSLMVHENRLYYGDNLDVLRRYIPDESIDLVYLDPPFNSNQDYNVLFAERDGSRAAAQIKAFGDTWRWDQGSVEAYEEIVERGPQSLAHIVRAMRTFLGESDMMAYLSMMAPRLLEMHRSLKASGSIFLHCDPTASHYLKLLLDGIFGPANFRSEVIWQRTTNTGSSKAKARRFSTDHDVLLFYSKNAGRAYFRTQYRAYTEEYIRHYYTHDDGDGRGPYQLQALKTCSERRRAELEAEGRIVEGKGRYPRFKDYLRGKSGVPINDVWTDIEPVNPIAKEKLGYPTQKPESLLERIIGSTLPEGGTVLDPFCGCGTTVAAAQKMGCRWIGIDVTQVAISLIKNRLLTAYGQGEVKYQVVGEPTTLPDAIVLAQEDRYQFQWWALGLVGARGTDRKKGADHGIDGRLFFHDEPGGRSKQIILSVKSGHVGVKDIRELSDVVRRERAEIGVLLTLESPTGPMRVAAADGVYRSSWGVYPRLQILTIEQLLQGARIEYPWTTGANVTLKRAPRAIRADVEILDLPLET